MSLEQLDLTRNNIGELPTGTFRQLSGLKILKLAVNSMRQVCEGEEWKRRGGKEGREE